MQLISHRRTNLTLLAATGILTGCALSALRAQELPADLPPAPAQNMTAATGISTVSDSQGHISFLPQSGQIALEGIIESLGEVETSGTGLKLSLNLQATSYQLADKPARAIAPNKIKPVNFEGQLLPAGAPPLRVGMRVQVLGVDEGTGSDLTAHAILVVPVSPAFVASARPVRAAPKLKPKKYTARFSTKGVTLSEIVMPAKFAPRPSARYAKDYTPNTTASALLYPRALSPDASTVYAGCKWGLPLKEDPKRGDTFENLNYLWSKQSGMQKIAENHPKWKALRDQEDVQRPRLRSWENAHKAQCAADHPGRKLESFNVQDMTPDGRVVCGWYELVPANFPPEPQDLAKYQAWYQARSKVTLGGGFIWRADTGFVNIDKYVKALTTAKGKKWSAPLTPNAISADGKTIACLAENTGKQASRDLCGSRILLIRNPAGFASGGVAQTASAAKPVAKPVAANGSLNLAALQGKPLSAYEKVLGQPVRVERLQNETQDELRFYRYPGFTRIRLSRRGASGENAGQLTDAIYAVECVFPKTAVPSWQQALKKIGYSSAKVKPRYIESAAEAGGGERIKTRSPWLEGIPRVAFAQWEIAGLPLDDRKNAHWPIDPANHHLYLKWNP